jgi:hypothetical protein
LFKAFQRANEVANEQRLEHVIYHYSAGLISKEANDALAKPIVTHGIKANRQVLETAAQYSFEQGLTPRLTKLEDVFAANAMNE